MNYVNKFMMNSVQIPAWANIVGFRTMTDAKIWHELHD